MVLQKANCKPLWNCVVPKTQYIKDNGATAIKAKVWEYDNTWNKPCEIA